MIFENGWAVQLLSQLLSKLPVLIIWGVAIYFCLLRRRENPKGTRYLLWAIAVQFLRTAWSFAYTVFAPLIYEMVDNSGSSRSNSISFFTLLYTAINVSANIGMWVLITMAVFARPTLDDTADGPQLDNEAAPAD